MVAAIPGFRVQNSTSIVQGKRIKPKKKKGRSRKKGLGKETMHEYLSAESSLYDGKTV